MKFPCFKLIVSQMSETVSWFRNTHTKKYWDGFFFVVYFYQDHAVLAVDICNLITSARKVVVIYCLFFVFFSLFYWFWLLLILRSLCVYPLSADSITSSLANFFILSGNLEKDHWLDIFHAWRVTRRFYKTHVEGCKTKQYIYISHRREANAKTRLHIRTVSCSCSHKQMSKILCTLCLNSDLTHLL